MKNLCFNFISTLFIILIFAACSQKKIIYPDDLVRLHENVLANIYDEPANYERVEQLLSEMDAYGSWLEIDYTSKERGGWTPRNHISNLLEISKAYQTNGTKFYHKKAISEKIHLGLNYWLDNDFQCPNWWYPEIGVPMVLAPVLILMEPELSEDQMQQGIKILNRAKIGMTGQNKVWLSGNVLLSRSYSVVA